jgi:hypothetical protein
MKETIGELVERFVEPDSNWYIDTFGSYTSVGMDKDHKEEFEAFLKELKHEDIEFEIESVGREGVHVVHVYV